MELEETPAEVEMLGEIVLYTLAEKDGTRKAHIGETRPAIVVGMSEDGALKLHVFCECHRSGARHCHVESACFGHGEGCWRFKDPPFQPLEVKK